MNKLLKIGYVVLFISFLIISYNNVKLRKYSDELATEVELYYEHIDELITSTLTVGMLRYKTSMLKWSGANNISINTTYIDSLYREYK